MSCRLTATLYVLPSAGGATHAAAGQVLSLSTVVLQHTAASLRRVRQPQRRCRPDPTRWHRFDVVGGSSSEKPVANPFSQPVFQRLPAAPPPVFSSVPCGRSRAIHNVRRMCAMDKFAALSAATTAVDSRRIYLTSHFNAVSHRSCGTVICRLRYLEIQSREAYALYANERIMLQLEAMCCIVSDRETRQLQVSSRNVQINCI